MHDAIPIKFRFAHFYWTRHEIQEYSPTPKISIYHRWSVLKTIIDTLQAVGNFDLVQRFSGGCFGHLLKMREGPTSGKVVFTLLTYQIRPPNGIDTEIWFNIGGQAIRMSPTEYALVTELLFRSSSFDHTGRHEPLGLGTYIRFTTDMRIQVAELLTRFADMNVNIGYEEDYLKAANILALYYFVLCLDDRKKIDPWVRVLVDNLELCDRFPWGAYSCGVLLHYVGDFPTMRTFFKKKSNFHGHV